MTITGVLRVSIAYHVSVIAIIGDTQRTLRAERVLLRREQNDAERIRIIADLAAQRPELVIHLGDMVCNGQRLAEWHHFDRLMAPIRAAGIPILPVLGNHDLWQGGRRAWPQVWARFPWLT